MERPVIAGLAVSLLAVSAAVGLAAADGAGTLKPRLKLSVGDRWQARVSEYPMHWPQPVWLPPVTWSFVAQAIEKTPAGQSLVITATREGAARPALRLLLDPEHQSVQRLEVLTPTQQGERYLIERPTPGEPFVSELSPLPLAFAAESNQTVEESRPADAGSRPVEAGSPSAKTDGPQPLAFTFGPRLTARMEPVDAGVGRAKIERGMAALKRERSAALEPAGIPRFVSVYEGPARRVEQVWDETTPWPLYTETETSRSWLVTYTKGKQP
jgi:hypothetical protein